MDLPSEDSLRWIVTRYAGLRAAHGEAFDDPELLEPTGRHFPDEFKGDAASVRALFERMLSYAPVSEDLGFDVSVAPATGTGGGGCGTGACGTGGAKASGLGRVMELGDRYVVELGAGDVTHPVLLAASLARSVGGIVLSEAGEEIDTADLAAMSEIASAMSGFGVLLMAGSALYAKGCGGLKMHRATQLSVEELAIALALFVKVHAKKPSAARAQLDTTQREAFDEAMRWADSNEVLIAKLRHAPAELADGIFTIEPIRGLFGRFLAKRRADEELPPDLAAPISKRVERTEEERRRIAETKALVDEALAGGE